jgi:hypothetical protein
MIASIKSSKLIKKSRNHAINECINLGNIQTINQIIEKEFLLLPITNHIMKYLYIFFFAIILQQSITAQQNKPLTYYLPDIAYDPAIPTPESYLGFQVGEWHVSHDQLLGYFKALDAASPLISLKTYAYSHERRPLVYATITSQKNHDRLDQIKANHQKMASLSTAESVNIDNLPAILYQGYTIHGNEPSGNNAALLVAYYLVAGQSAMVKQTLENTVILLDPCLNPDGVQRFSTWVNSHRGQNLITDPNSREYSEAWPGGRYNHYWFDMNRDWLLLVHPESRGRIATFHEWHPNVLTDHHEMGTNSTFFFQPGIPSSVNPNTPWENQILTEKIGTYHAAALDSIGSQYYTKASFDDFYYGKGSTYPDAHGCIGILFEQASSRGHLQESVNGLVSFPFTIRNQVVTSLSTQKAVVNMRRELLNFKRSFIKNAHATISREKTKSYIFAEPDAVKCNRFLDFLGQHQVAVYPLDEEVTIDRQKYDKTSTYIVPLLQDNPIIAKTIFEKVVSFQDSSFYDVSGWTVSEAFHIAYMASDRTQISNKTIAKSDPKRLAVDILKPDKNTYAYVIKPNQFYFHRAVQASLQSGLQVRITSVPINNGSADRLPAGTAIIPVQSQNQSLDRLHHTLTVIANNTLVKIDAVYSGNGVGDVAFGHPDVITIDKPSIIYLVSTGVDATSAGEIWQHLDLELGMTATMLEVNRLRSTSLKRYNTMILPEGGYGGLSDSDINKIKDWVSQGNTLITIGSATEWAADKKLINLVLRKLNYTNTSSVLYTKIDPELDAKVIGGSIFRTKCDLTHPLFFGYKSNIVPFMHSGTKFYDVTSNGFASPALYTPDFLVSGYLPRGLDKTIPQSSAITTHALGGGKVICFLDNPLFRGYWWAGMKCFNNAIFLSKLIDRRALETQP